MESKYGNCRECNTPLISPRDGYIVCPNCGLCSEERVYDNTCYGLSYDYPLKGYMPPKLYFAMKADKAKEAEKHLKYEIPYSYLSQIEPLICPAEKNGIIESYKTIKKKHPKIRRVDILYLAWLLIKRKDVRSKIKEILDLTPKKAASRVSNFKKRYNL